MEIHHPFDCSGSQTSFEIRPACFCGGKQAGYFFCTEDIIMNEVAEKFTLGGLFDILDVESFEHAKDRVLSALYQYSNLIPENVKLNDVTFEDTLETWKEIAISLSSEICLCSDMGVEETYKEMADSANVYFSSTNKGPALQIIETLSNIEQWAIYANLAILYHVDYDTMKNKLKDFSVRNQKDGCTGYSYTQKETGFVYIAKQLNEKNLYKIGSTSDMSKRISTFKTGNCFVEIIASRKSNNRIGLEKWLHKYYSNKKFEREWFNLSNDDIEELSDIFGFNFHIKKDEN